MHERRNAADMKTWHYSCSVKADLFAVVISAYDHKQLWTHMLMLWSDVITSALISYSLALPSFGRRDLLSLISVGSGWDVGVEKLLAARLPEEHRAHHGAAADRRAACEVWDLLSQELKTSTGTTGDEHLTDTPPKRKTHNQSCFTVKTSKYLREKQNSAR